MSWSSLDYRLHSPDSPSFIAMSMSWRSSSLRMEDRKPSVVWFISPVPFWNISIRMRAAHRVPFTVHMNMLITRNCRSYSEHCTPLNASTDIATISYQRWLTQKTSRDHFISSWYSHCFPKSKWPFKWGVFVCVTLGRWFIYVYISVW